MRQAILLVLVALGIVALVGVFAARIALRDQAADSTDIVGGLLSAIIWAVVALGAQNVVVDSSPCCGPESYSATGLSWIAVALAALSLLAMFMGTSSLVRFSRSSPSDEMR